MLEARLEVGEGDNEEQPNPEENVEQQIQNEDTQPEVEEEHTDEPWEIQLTPELKNQLGYRALQTRLAGIWRPTGTTHLIDLGYGYFIMHFDVLKDYQHALMDGPWFVGGQLPARAGLGSGFSSANRQNINYGGLDPSRTTSHRILPS